MSSSVYYHTVHIDSSSEHSVLDFSQYRATEYYVAITVAQQITASLAIRTPRHVSYAIYFTIHLQERDADITCWIIEELDEQQRGAITTQQLHSAPYTSSSVVIRSVVRDAAHAMYNGMIRIEEGASCAVALQNTATLLLGAATRTQATPALEILTHDVSCKHGSSCGTVSAEHMWYMQTRGMTTVQAQDIIVSGFLNIVPDTL